MIQIALRPDIEARLTAEAQARGVGVEAYVESIVEQAMTVATTFVPRQRTREEMQAFYEALAAHSDKIPQLPDEAFTRESFYQDHD